MICVKRSLKENLIDWFIWNYENLYCAMNKTLNSPDGVVVNPYHMERSILDHTLMVMDEVESRYSNGGFNTSKREFEILMLSALLHDTGKVVTKNVKVVDGELKSTFYNHEKASYLIAIAILSDNSLKDIIPSFDNDFASRVLSIVGNHDVYKFKDLSEMERCLNYKSFHGAFVGADYVPLSISLAKFTICDSKGRVTQEDISSSRIDRFEKYIEDFYSTPKKFQAMDKELNNRWLALDFNPFGGISYAIGRFSDWDYAWCRDDFNKDAMRFKDRDNSLVTFRNSDFKFHKRRNRSFLRSSNKKMSEVYSNFNTAVFVVRAWTPKEDVQEVLNGLRDDMIRDMKVPTAEEVDLVQFVDSRDHNL